MAKESVEKRYAGTPLYDGPLTTDPAFAWLQHKRLNTIGHPCRLPDCRALVIRTASKRRRWYCSNDCAIEARKRRVTIAQRLNQLDQALTECPVSPKGRQTTESGRMLEADLVYLRNLAILYSEPITRRDRALPADLPGNRSDLRRRQAAQTWPRSA